MPRRSQVPAPEAVRCEAWCHETPYAAAHRCNHRGELVTLAADTDAAKRWERSEVRLCGTHRLALATGRSPVTLWTPEMES